MVAEGPRPAAPLGTQCSTIMPLSVSGRATPASSMITTPRLVLLRRLACLAAFAWAAADGQAATPDGQAATPAAAAAATPPARAAKARPPSRAVAPPAAASAAATAPSGQGWQVGPRPAWVVDTPEPPPAGADPAQGTAAAAPQAHRTLLLDLQARLGSARPGRFTRWRMLAADPSALGAVSQPQIEFNPAFQTVTVHAASLWRDGQKLDRLKDARIELMRRERRLEQQVIDGEQTLLVVLSDVRVGEPVEIAYTIEGENPIFEGRISHWMSLATRMPTPLLHQRLSVPRTRSLKVTALGTTQQAEHRLDGDWQSWQLTLRDPPVLPPESQVPPWVRTLPWLQFSEWTDWAEVSAWGERLFSASAGPMPLLDQRVDRLRGSGLQGQALVDEALHQVQDEVRYFSVSLGESSHRPKAPERTLADGFGDCKDKTALLVALLRRLGFEARPALASVQRGRGLLQYAATHDLFDHAVTVLELDGKPQVLDATITGQGLSAASRGQPPFGAVLVAGSPELQRVPEGPPELLQLEFEQRWDFSRPDGLLRLTGTMRTHGLLAERWRAGLAAAGQQRVTDGITAPYLRFMPGLKPVGTPGLHDDRQRNQLELTLHFEQADAGQYLNGGVDVDLLAFELLDALGLPAEAQRQQPWLLDLPRRVTSRIAVVAPKPFRIRQTPAPVELQDRHLQMRISTELDGNTLTVVRRIERLSDEVLPADLAGYRDLVQRMRQYSGGRLRVPLLDGLEVERELQTLDRRVRSARSWRGDALGQIVLRNELGRQLDTLVLQGSEPGSRLAARALASRALAQNLLGDFARGQADAEAALAIDAQSDTAAEARAVALLGQGAAQAALEGWQALAARRSGVKRAEALSWLGSLQVHLGQAAAAEASLREAVERSSGDARTFALLWLFLAAEQQGAGRGQAAVAAQLDSIDATKLPGSLLHHLCDRIGRDELLRQARANREMERLNLAEAQFFVGQRLVVAGRRDEAAAWFKRTLETEATPFRELSYARLELARLPAR